MHLIYLIFATIYSTNLNWFIDLLLDNETQSYQCSTQGMEYDDILNESLYKIGVCKNDLK